MACRPITTWERSSASCSSNAAAYRTKINAGDAWTLRRTQSRSDLSGLALQVGIWQATFSANTGTTQFETFRIEGPNVNPPTATATDTPTVTPSATATVSPTDTPDLTPTVSPTSPAVPSVDGSGILLLLIGFGLMLTGKTFSVN